MLPKRDVSFQVDQSDVEIVASSETEDDVTQMPDQKKAAPASSRSVAEEKPGLLKERVVDGSGQATQAELDRLRDILFGSQARSTEKRINDLETRVAQMRHDLSAMIAQKVDSLANSSSLQLTSAHRELAERLTQQGVDHGTEMRTIKESLSHQIEQQETTLSADIRATQRALTEKLETQQTDQVTQLRNVQKELSQRLESFAADIFAQIRDLQKELGLRIDQMEQQQSAQMQSAQAESRQRDEALREELLLLAARLDGRKVSRQDLGQMLVEMGRRMAQEQS